MKNLIKFEELGMCAIAIYLIYLLDIPVSLWIYLLLFFTPDIGMIGYLLNPKVGAFTYNLLHHKGIASLLMILGIVLANDYLLVAGLIMFAHASFDRILGYGLKYPASFQHTSLGFIGRQPDIKNEVI